MDADIHSTTIDAFRYNQSQLQHRHMHCSLALYCCTSSLQQYIYCKPQEQTQPDQLAMSGYAQTVCMVARTRQGRADNTVEQVKRARFTYSNAVDIIDNV